MPFSKAHNANAYASNKPPAFIIQLFKHFIVLKIPSTSISQHVSHRYCIAEENDEQKKSLISMLFITYLARRHHR
jgi:hypothetical protein